MQTADGHAKSLAAALFGLPTNILVKEGIEYWFVSDGGPKTVAFYSLPSVEMFFDTKRGRLARPETRRSKLTVFEKKDMDPKRGEIAAMDGSTQDWNKASRRKLTPVPLQTADFFVVVNQAMNFSDIDIKSYKAQVISLSRINVPVGTEERGGSVAYRYLPHNRLVTPGNLDAGTAEFVWYGTSGGYNLAELLLTLAVGHKLNLPVEFDNYGDSEEATFAGQLAMIGFVRQLSKATGIDFDLTLMDTVKEVLPATETIQFLARAIESAIGHSVGLLYHPQHGEVKTDSFSWLDSNGYKTIEQLHAEGFRFGGALIYYAFYACAKNRKFVAVLYDGSKGLVHRLASPWMKDPHELWICPVGSFAIRPKGLNAPMDVQDPVELIQKLQVWGDEKMRDVLKRIWQEALDRVPLAPENIGSKVVIEVGDNGIEVITS